MRYGTFKVCVFEVFKAALSAVVFSLAAVLIFAAIIKLCGVPSSAITPVVRGIKAATVIGGVLLFVREEKGIFKGAFAGIAASAISYFIFSAMAGGEFSALFFAELLFGGIIGAISGIIAVNMRK